MISISCKVWDLILISSQTNKLPLLFHGHLEDMKVLGQRQRNSLFTASQAGWASLCEFDPLVPKSYRMNAGVDNSMGLERPTH